MLYCGDFPSQQTVYIYFTSHKADGTPIVLAGTPALNVYKDNVATPYTTAGDLVLTASINSVVGLNCAAITTTNAFFAVGHDYKAVLSAGTVDSVSVVGYMVGSFSIQNRPAFISPGTGTGQLDVTSGVVKSNMVQVLGAAITGTAANIVAAFTNFFNVATARLTCGGYDQTGDSYVKVNDATIGLSNIETIVAACQTVLNKFGWTGSSPYYAKVDVIDWNGATVATPDTAGYPKITVKVGTGTGEVNLASGKAPATIAAGDIATDAVTAAALKADGISKIADGICDEATSGHTTAGTVGADIQFTRDRMSGGLKLDSVNKQAVALKDDNVTELCRWNTKDKNGTACDPTTTSVAEKDRV